MRAVSARNEKGQSRGTISYLRHSFFAAWRFVSIEDLNRQLARWIDEVAHARKTPKRIEAAAACAMRRRRSGRGSRRCPSTPSSAISSARRHLASWGCPRRTGPRLRQSSATTSHRGVTSAELFMTHVIRFATCPWSLAYRCSGAAPKAGLVRLTARTSGRYLDHGGGNHSAHSSQASPEDDSLLVTQASDIWHLWIGMGEAAETGTKVSFRDSSERNHYLQSTSCVTDAKPDTIKPGYRLVGSGSRQVFKIHRVHKVPFCSLQGRCLLLDSLAGPGSPIVNGDEVAIETDQSCFLYPGPRTTSCAVTEPP